MLPPEQAAELLPWYMQWSRDLAGEMHRRRLSGTRRVVLTPSLSLITHVTAQLIGGVSPMMPVSYTTRASAPVPVPFPQLSPHVPSYRPITPNPCALGQQVTVVLSRLIVSPRLVYFYPGS